MNFLAHGHRWLDRPARLAGTALPDWLLLMAPASRLRGRPVPLHPTDDRSMEAEVLRGVRIHHAEDAWFHQQPAFVDLVREGALGLRTLHPRGETSRRFKPRFLAHVLVEMLLDGWLLARHPGLDADYRAALARVDPQAVEALVARHAPTPAPGLAEGIERFRTQAYLPGYDDDERMVERLARVSARIGLDLLPGGTASAVRVLRRSVHARAHELLPPPWPAREALSGPAD